MYTNVYNQIQHVIKFCNWSCFKILDNVKFSDVRGLRAHQRLSFGAVNPLLLRTLAWMKVQCSYAHDSKLIVIFPLGPTNHHRHWHVATLVNLSTSIHPSSKSSPEGVDLRHLGRYAPVLPFGARRPDHRGWSVFLEGNVVFFSPSKKKKAFGGHDLISMVSLKNHVGKMLATLSSNFGQHVWHRCFIDKNSAC